MRKYGLCAQNNNYICPFILLHLSHVLCKVYKCQKYYNSPLSALLVTKISLINYSQVRSYETSKFKMVIIFYVHMIPIFSCRVTNIVLNLKWLHTLDLYWYNCFIIMTSSRLFIIQASSFLNVSIHTCYRYLYN